MRSCRSCHRHKISTDREEVECSLGITSVDTDSIENGCGAFLTLRDPCYVITPAEEEAINYQDTERFFK